MGILLETGSVKESTQRELDPGTEHLSVSKPKTPKRVRLDLDKGIRVKGILGTNLDSDIVECLEGTRGLGRDLSGLVHLLVVRGLYNGTLAESVNFDSVGE